MTKYPNSLSTKLTPRELQIAVHAGLGYSTKRIAADLYISSRTVETHISMIYDKMNIRTRDELIDLMKSPEQRTGVTR